MSEEKLNVFIGINLLMGIHKLPTLNTFWSVDKGLGNIMIQKTYNHTFYENYTESPFR